jgi:cytochrome c oxidase subunit 4
MVTSTHAHPAPKTYWITALALFVLTAVEVGIVYVSALDAVRGLVLVAFGVAKFVIVVAVFMHLKYDLKSYRFYFSIGIAGTLAVFAVVLAMFRAF